MSTRSALPSLLSLTLFLALGASASAATLNVPAQYATIQAAVTAAANGDTVLIADGTYSGDGNRDIDFAGKNLTVTSQHGAASTIIDCGGYAYSSNGAGIHRGFYFHSGETAAVVSGLTIENGYTSADQNIADSGDGGGICIDDSGVTVQNCTFTNNAVEAGGMNLNVNGNGGGVSITNTNSTVLITGCTFTNNGARDYGGGVYCSNNGAGTITLTNCLVSASNNDTQFGGAVNNSGSGGTITLNNCSITKNRGIGIVNYGGAVHIAVNDCSITGNTNGNSEGGGIYTSFTDSSGVVTITNCSIIGNSAGYGGGVYNDNANEGPFNYNNYGGTITLTNCTIADNVVEGYSGYTNSGLGAGVFNSLGSSTGAQIFRGTITLTNCSITDNIANGGGNNGGVYNTSDGGMGTITLTNDIVYGNLGSEMAGGSVAVSYCDIQGGYTGDFAGPGNIDADPLFLNPPTDLRLAPGSPCLGAGTHTGAPATDKNGASRGNPPSIGAYELPATMTPTSHTQLLWDNVNGQACLWTISPNGAYTYAVYGPFAGWTAKAIAAAPDGTEWLLWTNTSGQVSLWHIAGSSYTHTEYGPFAGFTAVSVSVDSDGSPHLLWDKTGGTFACWTISPVNGTFTYTENNYGYSYTQTAIASNTTATEVLLTLADGSTYIGTVSANGTNDVRRISAAESSRSIAPNYGPYSGYTAAVALSVGPDDFSHLLWDNANGQAALWTLDLTTSAYTSPTFGPFPGWTAKAIATGPDNITRLLWDNTNGQTSLWNVTGSTYTHMEYGPFNGWTAVAVSAGP